MATKTLNIKPQRRFFQMERAAVNVDERTARLCFVTEAPVERWFGNEILDCSPASVQLERLQQTGPLLYNHDMDCLIGKVENVWIGTDRKGYADVRFSTADDCMAIWQKVQDGTLDNVSVGYLINSMVLEGKAGDVETYRATSWTPYEISMVSVPADIGCGIGRTEELEREVTICIEICDSAECAGEDDDPADPAMAAEDNGCNPPEKKGEHQMQEKTPEQIQKEVRTAEIERINTIRTLGDKHQAVELATKAIDAGDSVDAFRAALLDRPVSPVQTPETRQVGMSVQENLRYNPASLAAFKRFGSDAEKQAHRAGQWVRGVLMGDEQAKRWCTDNGLDTRVMVEGSNSAGGYLVPDMLEGAIIDLRAKYGVCRQLAQIFPMSSDTLSIPKWSAGTTAYFPSETAATTASDVTLGQVALVAKEMSALTLMSQALAADSVIDLASFLAEQQAYAFAVKEDQIWIDGDGTSTYGGMTGLKALLETASMAGAYATGSGIDTTSEYVIGDLTGVMAKLPSYARSGAAWLMSPAYEAAVAARLRAAAGGNDIVSYGAAVLGAPLLGYPVVTCEPCYTDLSSDYSGKAVIFFGNFRQGTAFGERKGITVQVLRERYAEYRQIGVLATERISIVNHGVGDTSNAGPICAIVPAS